jgi:hypothetical protein
MFSLLPWETSELIREHICIPSNTEYLVEELQNTRDSMFYVLMSQWAEVKH